MGDSNPEALHELGEPEGASQGLGDSERQHPAPIVFGSFELRPATHELFKNGIRIRLQSKPFQILETLLARPGQLVTRDELHHKLWPSGTFVDFESGLNTAVNRLRAALSDSAEEPRYIETLPRLGYRLICPVESGKNCEPLPVPASPQPPVLPAAAPMPARALASGRTVWWAAASALVLAGLIVAAIRFGPTQHPPLDFRPITFRGGAILSARFLGHSRVIYSLSKAHKRKAYVANLDGSSYALPGEDDIVASAFGPDLAVVSGHWGPNETLLRLQRTNWQGRPLGVLAQNISGADWSVDGKHLALIRPSSVGSQVESPPGRVLYRSQGWLDSLRLSRDGRRIAFIEHPGHDDDGGHVRVIEEGGTTAVLTPEWSSAGGLAWSPNGREVWFTASAAGLTRSLYAVSNAHRIRKLSNQPLSLRLLDVAANGQVLLAVDDLRMLLRTASDGKEAEISQFDFSHIDDIARNGDVLLFTEAGDAGGPHYAAYAYDLCRHEARRFGSGNALALSSDARQALTVDPRDRTILNVVTLDSGASTRVPNDKFQYQWARFWDATSLIVGGSYPGGPLLMGRQQIASGALTPLAGVPYMDGVTISPDRTKIAGRAAEDDQVFDLVHKTIQSLSPEYGKVLAWSADSHTLFLLKAGSSEYFIERLDLATNRASLWKSIGNEDGLLGLSGVALAPESGRYAYSAHLEISRLYITGNPDGA